MPSRPRAYTSRTMPRTCSRRFAGSRSTSSIASGFAHMTVGTNRTFNSFAFARRLAHGSLSSGELRKSEPSCLTLYTNGFTSVNVLRLGSMLCAPSSARKYGIQPDISNDSLVFARDTVGRSSATPMATAENALLIACMVYKTGEITKSYTSAQDQYVTVPTVIGNTNNSTSATVLHPLGIVMPNHWNA